MPSEIDTKEREPKLDTDDDTIEALHEHLVEHEVEEIADHSRLRVPQIYQVVRHEGETEMARPAVSLWWSGVAAGSLDHVFGFRRGGAAQISAGGRVAAASDRVRLYRRFSAGRARAPAIVHRKHDNRGPAGRRQSHREEFLSTGSAVGDRVRGESDRNADRGACSARSRRRRSPELRETIIEISHHAVAHGFFEAIFLAIPAGF